MTNILLTILCSTLLFTIFKLYPKFKINTLQALIWNYFFAFLIGIFSPKTNFIVTEILVKAWLLPSIILGILFIVVFFAMARTSQLNGVSVASIASKMSLIIPIIFGLFFLKEQVAFIQIIGIVIAIFAVYFTTKKEKSDLKVNYIGYTLLLFFGTGIIDTSINYVQDNLVTNNEYSLFTAVTFLIAFAIGCIAYLYDFIKNKTKFAFKNIIAGLFLGIPNYYSLHYLILSLQHDKFESATVFTVINVGIITFTALIALILFKEKLYKHNYIGIAMAVIALFLITY